MDWSLRIAVFALILAIFATWRAEELARFFHVADNKPNKFWKKKISAKKHFVSHRPDDKTVLAHADDRDLQFLADFWGFADYLNEVYLNTPWSFENSGRVESGLGTEHGASRTIEVRYNEQQAGTIETSSFGYGNRPVRVEINLVNARHFQSHDVLGLAGTVSELICNADNLPIMRQQIYEAMLNCMWEVGPQVIGNPEFEFAVYGNAEAWIIIKDPYCK